MTKKNLKPQQAAPVQREINTTSSKAGTGLTPHILEKDGTPHKDKQGKIVKDYNGDPFAGDDSE